MATTTATIARWGGLDPDDLSPEESEELTRLLAVAQEWAYPQVADDDQERESVQHAVLLYAVRRLQQKEAPAGVIDADGFQSQGFVPMRSIEQLLDPFRIWAVG